MVLSLVLLQIGVMGKLWAVRIQLLRVTIRDVLVLRELLVVMFIDNDIFWYFH